MRTEAFIEWMLLEAKASREGLPVEPEVKQVALMVEATFEELVRKFVELAERMIPEMERLSRPRGAPRDALSAVGPLNQADFVQALPTNRRPMLPGFMTQKGRG